MCRAAEAYEPGRNMLFQVKTDGAQYYRSPKEAAESLVLQSLKRVQVSCTIVHVILQCGEL